MSCPDDDWDAEHLFDDDTEEWPLDPPPRPIRDVIRDLADYQPTR